MTGGSIPCDGCQDKPSTCSSRVFGDVWLCDDCFELLSLPLVERIKLMTRPSALDVAGLLAVKVDSLTIASDYGSDAAVTIDGTRVEHLVKSLTLTLRPGHLPELTLDVAP